MLLCRCTPVPRARATYENRGLYRDPTTRDTPTMAVGEQQFRVFRDLCDAFNGLGKGDLDLNEPFTAKPFRYLHKDVELEDYPAIPGATWHVGFQGALQWTRNLWESFEDFHLQPREFIPGKR